MPGEGSVLPLPAPAGALRGEHRALYTPAGRAGSGRLACGPVDEGHSARRLARLFEGNGYAAAAGPAGSLQADWVERATKTTISSSSNSSSGSPPRTL